jgi:hypothetical protein
MGAIYDMANGMFRSPPAQTISTPASDEIVPAPVLRLQPSSPADIDGQPHPHNVHLIRTLLRKG